MATVEVVFSRTKSANTVSRVRLMKDEAAIALDFSSDKVTKSLEVTDYGLVWELTGKHGDELKVTWATQGLTGTLLQQKIDRTKHRLLPGGKYMAEGVSSYKPEQL